MHFETAQAPNILSVNGGIARPSGFPHVPGNESGDLNETIEIDQEYKGKQYSKYIIKKFNITN